MDGELADLKRELSALRHGQGLAQPQAVLGMTPTIRTRLAATAQTDAESALAVRAALDRTLSRLSKPDEVLARAEFNLETDKQHPTLTGRQEDLAAALGCSVKTIRRRSEQMLTALCVLLSADEPEPAATAPPTSGELSDEGLRRFWRLTPRARIDVVCSEIPASEVPYYADPADRNYLRYAKFADLDTLMYVRVRLAQLEPRAAVRDFSPGEHYDTAADTIIVVGGPPWNAKYREFLPQLPYHFEPHALGHDDPLVVPLLDDLHIGPRWTADQQLLDDVAVFARLTLTSGATVVLLGGCLTLGVLGSARTFLDGKIGAANADWIAHRVGDDDVVVVTEVRRIGGMVDISDLAVSGPLLMLSRTRPGLPFEVVTDNTERYNQ